MNPMRPSFHPLSDFPPLVELSRHWEIIRAEYRRLDVPEHDIARVGISREEIYAELVARGLASGWLQGWTHDRKPNPQWLSYALMLFDSPPLDVREKMPRTVELLERIGGIKVAAPVNATQATAGAATKPGEASVLRTKPFRHNLARS